MIVTFEHLNLNYDIVVLRMLMQYFVQLSQTFCSALCSLSLCTSVAAPYALLPYMYVCAESMS